MTDPVVLETLGVLEMPRVGLKKWFKHVKDSLNRHGGEQHYRDLLAMLTEYEQALTEESR